MESIVEAGSNLNDKNCIPTYFKSTNSDHITTADVSTESVAVCVTLGFPFYFHRAKFILRVFSAYCKYICEDMSKFLHVPYGIRWQPKFNSARNETVVAMVFKLCF